MDKILEIEGEEDNVKVEDGKIMVMFAFLFVSNE